MARIYAMRPYASRCCDTCGGRMRLLSRATSRVLVYWCGGCHKSTEMYQYGGGDYPHAA